MQQICFQFLTGIIIPILYKASSCIFVSTYMAVLYPLMKSLTAGKLLSNFFSVIRRTSFLAPILGGKNYY